MSQGEETFTSRLDKFNSNLWAFYITVPAAIGMKFVDGEEDRRVVCTLNHHQQFQCALMHKGDGDYFINVNKKIRDALGVKGGDELQVRLVKDESEYGLPMPEELQEVLDQDEEGNALFHALTMGKQRTLLYIAANVKDTQKRINRALAIVNHLKMNNGKVNFRVLNEAIKNAK